MDRASYDHYLHLFNARDYDGVLSHFTEDCEISFAGYSLQGYSAIRSFYAFFHDYVEERITVSRYQGGEETVAIEAIVRLAGKRDLPVELLEAKGLGRLFPLAKGQVVAVPQFIHYHLRDGKFVKALCAIFPEPDVIVTA